MSANKRKADYKDEKKKQNNFKRFEDVYEGIAALCDGDDGDKR